MDTEEDILAIYINLINMGNVFTNLQMDFVFSIQNYCKKKSNIRNILVLRTNDKHKVVKTKPVVRKYWVRPRKVDAGRTTLHREKLWKKNGKKISECHGKCFEFNMTLAFETRSQLTSKMLELYTICQMKAV